MQVLVACTNFTVKVVETGKKKSGNWLLKTGRIKTAPVLYCKISGLLKIKDILT